MHFIKLKCCTTSNKGVSAGTYVLNQAADPSQLPISRTTGLKIFPIIHLNSLLIGRVEERILDARIAHYRSLCYAENTKRSYSAYLNSYLCFCGRMGYRAFPAEINTLCRYILHLAERLQASSIPKYLSIIRLVHSEMGLPSPIRQNWTLDSLLRGVKRDKGLVVKRKLPITPDILLKIHSSLNLKIVIDILFWAVCLEGFFGLFRKANLLPLSHNSTGYHFFKSDVSFIAGGLLMRVRGS